MVDVKASTAVDTACPPAAVELPVPVVPAGVGLPDDEGLGLPIEYLQKLFRLKGKTVLVTGGCGFVGRHIVFQLLCAGAKVRVFEVPQALANPKAAKYPQVEYVSGDVTNKLDLLHALVPPETRARINSGDNLNAPELKDAADVDTVIHVASPPPTINKPELFKAVNIGGTQNVMDCAIAVGCTRMVYTSSASVVADGLDQKNYDETRPEPVQKLDGYTISKLRGEQVVLRYGKEKRLATCAMRPHAIFGPRDPHFWTALAEVGKAGKSKWMIGDGTNLVDHTYVENVAYSHTLAAAKLVDVDQPINAQAYFITNREPHLFWDFLRWVQQGYGWPQPRLILPYSLMWTIAWICGILKLPTTFNMQRVSYAGTYHYYSSEKAVRDFGYEPPFNLQQGVHKTLTYLRKFSPGLFNPNPPKPQPKATETDKPASGVKAFVQGWGAFVAMIAAIIGLVYFAVSNACCQWCGVKLADVGVVGLVWRTVKTLVPALVAWKAISLTPFVPLGLQTVWFTAANGQPASLKGKNVVITGGNKGIGFETAIGLAALGANVAIACRDAGRAAAAVADIKKQAAKRMGDGVVADAVPVEALSLDLSSFASVNKLVDVLARRSSDAGRQVDVLICNAGGMCDKTLTADGHDMTFQSNYLSHFLLTDRLLKRGVFAADARIVNVSSLTHWQVNFTAADMEHISAPKSDAALKAPFNAFFAYCRSKLAQVLHTRVLHAVLRSQKSNIAVLAVHPGTSSTDFVNHFHIPGARAFCSVFTQSARQCAQTILYAACSRELQNVSGQYVANSAIGLSSAHSKDMSVARDLYTRSLALLKDV